MIELIGKNAGTVWTVLNEKGQLSVKGLKKATKIRTDKELFAAVGWLAKEGKLSFSEKEAEIFIALV